MDVLAIFQAPAGFDFPLVAALTAFIALPVKVLVDVVKAAIPKIPPTTLPVVGLIVAYIFCLVVLVAAEIPFRGSVYAQCAIAAVGAQVGAMAVTALQTHVNKVDEKIQTALDAKPGTTRAQVDAKVKEKA